jgi:hypothetical protein
MAVSPRREFFAKLALLGGFAALGSAARAEAQIASSATFEDITCDNGMPAVLAYPAGGGSFPTVILMHERYGLCSTRVTSRCAARATDTPCWRLISFSGIPIRQLSMPASRDTTWPTLSL